VSVLYITSDIPGAGKTALAGALPIQWSGQGKRVAYFKPFSANPRGDGDVEFLGTFIPPGDGVGAQVTPLALPEAQERSQALSESAASELRRSVDGLAAGNDLVLVEGPSLCTPGGSPSSLSGSLAEALDAKVLLILHYRPGLRIDQVVSACEPFGQKVQGVLINSVTRFKEREARATFGSAVEADGIKCLGTLPEDPLMLSVTVGQLAEHLDGDWVMGQEKAQDLVETYLIGGNIMDSGATYFGRADNKAVIARGDRPDIHLAALSTPTTCLVLTGGHRPIEYVHYQAQQEEVPVIVVQADTVSTAQTLASVIERATVHHPRKLERFLELLRVHTDLDSLTEGLDA
jgi:BioD-like phosphotransacetylase family protein